MAGRNWESLQVDYDALSGKDWVPRKPAQYFLG